MNLDLKASALSRRMRFTPRILVALVLITLSLFAVAKVGSEFAEGESFAFDAWALVSLRDANDPSQPLGPAWLKPMFIDITALGGTTALTLLTLVAVGYLLTARKVTDAVFLAAATGGGAILGKLLKLFFARPRPEVVPHFVDVTSASFPSGHTVNSAIVYLTLGAILARVQPTRRLTRYVMVSTFVLAFLVGISRIYLGVHYPTDVLAGWAVGGTWALLCWTIARALHVDGPPVGPDTSDQQG